MENIGQYWRLIKKNRNLIIFTTKKSMVKKSLCGEKLPLLTTTTTLLCTSCFDLKMSTKKKKVDSSN